jgi:flagellar hook-basal body complex protein FliE
MTIPAAAAAAYRAVAQAGAQTPTTSIAPANLPGGNFSDFLTGAIKDSINTIRQGETAATAQVQGKANLVDVVQSVNAAELTLDTVVAVRDKVVAAYQSIMNMPI